MREDKSKMIWIKLPYWLGIIADGFWAVALFFPPLYGIITGNNDFNPDFQLRIVMGIAGVLMSGWTILLIWAVKKPVERRGVILITTFPVSGLFIIILLTVINGNLSNILFLIKTFILFISMIISYILAGKVENNRTEKG